MSLIESLFGFLILALSHFGKLALIALGLAVIFGIMGIINFAHGEFILVGAYTTAMGYHAGFPLLLAIFVGGLAAGIFGLIVERLIIQHLYDRLIETLVATWGVSLIVIQLVRIQFGGTFAGIHTPLGSIQYGAFSASTYRIALAGAAIVLFASTYAIFMYTRYGLHSRAAMQNKEMAQCLGIPTKRVYMKTFFFGSVLSGIAGGLIAPTVSLTPDMGTNVLVEAFVTVIVGGANVIVGTSLAALSLGIIQAPASMLFGTLGGYLALLITTVLLIRVLPEGLTGVVE
ncbi:ABC transporter permease subunit [Natrarchaeobius oligotrophus]|uniref:Branched-chain amino acid ABC transporter permease n=1 Tax=Natrarchaeobius chitinivorans TaxID=1679083 RepID=A0A3N6PFR5_NATCH|nr:branched-chain amino acid ABC transporter permease [Natrarchaeobius chitinivorans]RQG98949.1 branched-chain amino acid ABC transporter permease [Natrarchaeobius chitinivorans]